VRTRLSPLLLVLGTLLLTGGLLAGIVNREVIDGSRFADHVDNIRKDPAVARQVGAVISDRVLAVDPDLVAIRPLVESASVALVASSAFGPVVQRSVEQLHAAFTQQEPGVLRLADVGAVLSALLRTADPAAASQLPPGLDVTLSNIGAQTFASDTLTVAHQVHLLAWLLPLLALLCWGCALLLAEDRRRTAPRIGWSILAAGMLLAVIGVVGWILTSFADTDTLSGAVVVATWHELRGPYWSTTVGALLGGALMSSALEGRLSLSPRRIAAQSWEWARRTGGSRRERLVQSAAFLVLGLALLLRGEIVVTAAAAVVGVGLIVLAGEQLLALAQERVAGQEPGRREFAWRPQWTRVAVIALAVVVLVGLFGVLARPMDEDVPAAARISAIDGPCNGHRELCDRRYDDVSYAATHNAMSAATNPRWFLPEQPDGLVSQLDNGIRVLLIDTWYGQTTQRPGVIATTDGQTQAAFDELSAVYGKSVLDSALRLRDAASLTPTGPKEPYLCHGLCELGSLPFEPQLAQVAAWMSAHPREVVTLFIQDEVSPADTAAAFDESGLSAYVHTQEEGQAWPTLGEMISSGQRLVVLMENHGGGTTYPWLLQGFDWVQDTPFDSVKPSDFSCRLLRGSKDNPIFLINHWLNNAQSRVSDAAKVNAFDVLWPRVRSCEEERGLLPNYVAVDFYDQGDLLKVVDKLNGFD
jgi:hypothetical protein